MSENLIVDFTLTKEGQYKQLQLQLEAMIVGEPNLVANTANIVAALKQTFGWLWVGVYWVDGPTELVLGPFQGPIACTRIQKGKGVCGHVWQTGKSILVPNVDLFPGHIACSSESKSEVVVPILAPNAEVLGVLDVDSVTLDHFSQVDVNGLEAVAALLSSLIIPT